MNLEQKTQEFWWSAKLWRQKQDEASYQAMLTLESDVYLTPRLKNRVLEIKREHDKDKPSPSGGPLRGPSVA